MGFKKRLSAVILGGIISASSALTAADAKNEFIFGIGTHMGQEADYLYAIKQAGAMAVRDDIRWSNTEKEKGILKVSERDIKYVDRCVENNLSIICIIDYSNKLYDNGDYPSSPEAIEAYVRHAETVVKTFKGKTKLYQIWNEWDGGCDMRAFGKGKPDVYVNLLAAVYPRIKAIDPDAIVIANSICTGDKFLEDVLKLGMLKHCDAIALHTYVYGQPQEHIVTETWYQRMLKVDKMLKDANSGKEFPMYITEIGWPTQVDSRGSTETHSADCLAQMYILANTLPYIKGVWWYDFKDDGWKYEYNENNFGLTRPDLTPKQSYFTYKDITSFLRGASFVERIDVGDPLVWIMKFSRNNKNIICSWSEYKDIDIQAHFKSSESSSPLTVCNAGRGRIERHLTDGKISLMLRSRPWIMEGSLKDIKVEKLDKREFKESLRPQRVEIKVPAAIAKATSAESTAAAPVYHFGEEKYYRLTSSAKRNGKEDLDASFSMKWTKNSLLLTVNVKDDAFVQTRDASDAWAEDSLQIAFHAFGDDPADLSHTDFCVSLGSEGARVYKEFSADKKTTGLTDAIKAKISKNGGNLTYELEIPVSEISLSELETGMIFAMSILVNDNDNKERKGYLRWGDGIGHSKDPSQYNWIMLEK